MLLGGSRDTLLDGTDFFFVMFTLLKQIKEEKKEEEMIKKAFKLRSGENRIIQVVTSKKIRLFLSCIYIGGTLKIRWNIGYGTLEGMMMTELTGFYIIQHIGQGWIHVYLPTMYPRAGHVRGRVQHMKYLDVSCL